GALRSPSRFLVLTVCEQSLSQQQHYAAVVRIIDQSVPPVAHGPVVFAGLEVQLALSGKIDRIIQLIGRSSSLLIRRRSGRGAVDIVVRVGAVRRRYRRVSIFSGLDIRVIAGVRRSIAPVHPVAIVCINRLVRVTGIPISITAVAISSVAAPSPAVAKPGPPEP